MNRVAIIALLLAATASAQVQIGTGVQIGAATNGYVDILSPSKTPGSLVGNSLEYQTVAAGATKTLLNYSGSGYVAAQFMVLSTSDTASLTNDTVNVYYDGHGSPDISIPAGYFFGVPGISLSGSFGTYNRYQAVTYRSGTPAISYSSHIPLPFSTGIKIDLVNVSAGSVTLFSQIAVESGLDDTWPNTRYLFAATTSVSACALGSTLTLANVTTGIGRYVGVAIQLSGGTASDQEGNFSIYLNGGGSPSFNSSGFEDYFETGNNWQGVNSSQVWAISGQTEAVWLNSGSYPSDPIGAVRFHIDDPVTFTNGFKLTWMCGDPNEGSSGNPNVNATVWYYTQ